MRCERNAIGQRNRAIYIKSRSSDSKHGVNLRKKESYKSCVKKDCLCQTCHLPTFSAQVVFALLTKKSPSPSPHVLLTLSRFRYQLTAQIYYVSSSLDFILAQTVLALVASVSNPQQVTLLIKFIRGQAKLEPS